MLYERSAGLRARRVSKLPIPTRRAREAGASWPIYPLKLKRFLSAFHLWRVFNGERKMTDGQQLLAQYAESGSETAFRELVTRYVDLVYSAALRLVNGDKHLAEDVTQT